MRDPAGGLLLLAATLALSLLSVASAAAESPPLAEPSEAGWTPCNPVGVSMSGSAPFVVVVVNWACVWATLCNPVIVQAFPPAIGVYPDCVGPSKAPPAVRAVLP
jgi:hypothetical protein